MEDTQFVNFDKIKRWKKAQGKAMDKLFNEFHYDRFRVDPGLIIDDVPDARKEEFMDWMQDRSSKRYKYIMVTVNPEEGTNVLEFVKRIYKSCSKCWIESCM